jgi:hypothetical protein
VVGILIRCLVRYSQAVDKIYTGYAVLPSQCAGIYVGLGPEACLSGFLLKGMFFIFSRLPVTLHDCSLIYTRFKMKGIFFTRIYKGSLFTKICVLLTIALLWGQPCQAQRIGSIVKSVKKGYDGVRKTLKKAEKDARRATGTALSDVVREVGQGVQNVGSTIRIGTKNVENELMRVGPIR